MNTSTAGGKSKSDVGASSKYGADGNNTGGGKTASGSTWTVGQGSPQAPAATQPSVLPSPERGVAVFS
jgi:hypothetical protein